MLQIPPAVMASFEVRLVAENISKNLHGYYKKCASILIFVRSIIVMPTNLIA